MAGFLGDVSHHIGKILDEEGEDPNSIYEIIANLHRAMIGFLISCCLAIKHPELMEKLTGSKLPETEPEKEFTWDDITKNLDFDMPQLGTLKLDN